jgi:hypothetical protein
MRTAFSAGGGESAYCFAGEALVVAQTGEVPARDDEQASRGHLAFHATHLDGFETPDAIAELGALATLLIPPAIALWAIHEPARVG